MPDVSVKRTSVALLALSSPVVLFWRWLAVLPSRLTVTSLVLAAFWMLRESVPSWSTSWNSVMMASNRSLASE